jgi:hypothetical protein
MKLTYRGVRHTEESSQFLTAVKNKEITYRGNSPKARINPKFPGFKYVKQLFNKSDSRPVFDPITFWYDHKREFIEVCWRIDDVKRLNEALNVTLQIERTEALTQKQKTQLKYRGVTYYR